MPFPLKFKHLLEPDPETVPTPSYLWLTWAVCALDTSACGWAGWMTEAVFQRTGERHRTLTGDRLLPAVTTDICPQCGRPLFRTGVAVRCEPSIDQSPPEGELGRDHEVGDIEYE